MPFEAVECFWVEPTGKAIRSLRRFRRGDANDCPSNPFGYHNVYVELEGEFDARWASGDDGARYIAHIDPSEYAGDERWPTRCDCGYQFTEDDHWQVNQHLIYESADGRRAWIDHAHGKKPTPGAMFDTFWRPELRKEDGRAISVICPDGTVWCIDDEATSGGHWSRQGSPPCLTVSPSIQTPEYHGHLNNGVLTAG